MTETKSKTEMLIAQHRRAKLAQRSGLGVQEFQQDAAMDRARVKVAEQEARGLAAQVMGALPDVDQKMAALEKSDQVDKLLAELKGRALLLPK
jgi:phage shock protein A